MQVTLSKVKKVTYVKYLGKRFPLTTSLPKFSRNDLLPVIENCMRMCDFFY